MSRRHVIIFAAALVTSTALILPTSGLAAQNWTSFTHAKDGTVLINDGRPIVEGSGRVVRQNRAVAPFVRVETFGAEEVEVRFGPRPSLVIAADDNILPLLTSAVSNGTLKLKSRGSYRMRGPIKVWITTPNLEEYKTFGSGGVTIHQVNNPRLALGVYGSSDIQATGRTGMLDVAIHGSGSARLAGLTASNAKVGLYGSGEALVRTSGLLNASVFGSGTVRYVGQPQDVRRQRFGSGRIVAAN